MKKNAPTAKTNTRNRVPRFSAHQRDILISALACIGMVFGAFYWIQHVEEPRALNQRIDTVTSNIADHQRGIVRDVIDQLGDRVNKQTSNPELLTALEQGNISDDSLFAQSLRRAFP